METITWTQENLAEFKKLYMQTKLNREDQLVFEGHDFLVAYATYLIKYLDELEKLANEIK